MNNEMKMRFDPNTGKPLDNISENTQNNNMKMRFDPNTGKPINDINENAVVQANANNAETSINDSLSQNNVTNINNIPTVDQSSNEFINNTQTISSERIEKKKGGLNYTFIIILFIVILISIIFLFPYLAKLLLR